MPAKNNIFYHLRQLIWTAFIGVISFQLIAPAVWEYMYRLAGIEYDTSYWLFIIAYLLIVRQWR